MSVPFYIHIMWEMAVLVLALLMFSFFRYKYNVSIREINQAVVKSILQSVLEDTSRSKQAMVQQLDKVSGLIHIRLDLATVEPPLTDTSAQRTAPNNGQIFSSQNTVKQRMTPPYSEHLSTTDIKIGPKDVRNMEVPLY